MRCKHCKLFDYNEVGEPCCYLLPIADETCRLLYYDKHGVVGCYVQKWLGVNKKYKQGERRQIKSVLLSIQPQWCELIASGKKTIEVRKTAPKLETPFKVYVYQTKHKGKSIMSEALNTVYGGGKVIGSFVCDRVRLCIPFGLKGHLLSQEVYREMCLTKEQLDKYGGLKTLYGWHITEPKLFDKPKELGAFRKVCLNGKCSDCIYEECKIIRPPQSWQYVEELQ